MLRREINEKVNGLVRTEWVTVQTLFRPLSLRGAL